MASNCGLHRRASLRDRGCPNICRYGLDPVVAAAAVLRVSIPRRHARWMGLGPLPEDCVSEQVYKTSQDRRYRNGVKNGANMRWTAKPFGSVPTIITRKPPA